MEYKKLKMQYAASNSARKEAEALLSKYQNDREELIALREFAYHLEQETPEIETQSLDEMKEAIAAKKYVIIGGHVNWVNKLKAEFPGWTYILPSTFKTVDAGSLTIRTCFFFLHRPYQPCGIWKIYWNCERAKNPIFLSARRKYGADCQTDL